MVNGPMFKPTCSYETSMEQAEMTGKRFFLNAIDLLDDAFREGYAENHPELVASMVHAYMADMMHSSNLFTKFELNEQLEQIANSLESISAVYGH